MRTMMKSTSYTGIEICLLILTAIITVSIVEFLFIDVYAQNGTVNPNGAQLSKDLFSVQNLIIPHAGGGFSSLQTDSGNKVWITTGKWDLVSDPSKIGQSNSSSVGFNASIVMRGIDNLNEHEHKMSDFKLTKGTIHSTTKGSIFTFDGTGTIETPLGIHPDVPISIKIIDKQPLSLAVDNQTQGVMPQWVPSGHGTIILSIDQSAQDHYGNTPIYGNVRK
jgi:hypothetical protein